FTEAEPIWRAVLEGRRKSLPEGNWEIGLTETMLGASLIGEGRLADAEPLLLAGYEHQVSASKPPAPAGQDSAAAHMLSILDEKWGNPEQAATWRARAKP